MEEFSFEQRYVADAFQKGMVAYKDEPLLLYGFGRKTEAILRLTTGYTIAGILGPNKTEGELYGKPILSLEQAAALSKKIVIIAPDASQRIIFRRIQKFAAAHQMQVFDFSGMLLKETTDSYDQSGLEYWTHSWNELQQEIERHSVISFDIFDTLLARYILRPHDLFTLMEEDIHRQYGLDIPFEKIRIAAEHDCDYGATIIDIYEKIHQAGFSEKDCEEWLKMELDWEEKLTFPKKRMLEAFRYALALGKQVFLTSDMYLTKAALTRILSMHGITGYTDLLVSCEEKAQKSDGSLFQVLLSKVSGKSVLHIGDNRFNDIEVARHMGIDAWQVWSGYDLFMVSSLSELLVKRMPNLGDRLALGLLCAKLFEDPFVLHETKGKVVLTTAEQIGYCFVGPWALGFMQWVAQQTEALKIQQFLYPSRDGFLFYNVAQLMQKSGYMSGVEQRYVKASRRALSVAAVRSLEDLRQILSSQRFRGTNGEMLREMFRVEPEATDDEQNKIAGSAEENIRYLSRYTPQILVEAQYEYKNYQLYLQKQGVFNDKKTAVFDFIAGGTVQFYLEKHLKKRLTGLYCGTIAHPNEMFPDSGHVLAAFGNGTAYKSESVMFQLRETMEVLLVDGDNMLDCMDENGEPIFRHGNFSYDQALQVQKYVCKFVSEYLRLFKTNQITLKGAEKLLSTMFRRSCTVEKPVLDMFAFYDEAIPGEITFTVID